MASSGAVNFPQWSDNSKLTRVSSDRTMMVGGNAQMYVRRGRRAAFPHVSGHGANRENRLVDAGCSDTLSCTTTWAFLSPVFGGGGRLTGDCNTLTSNTPHGSIFRGRDN